ncbi:FAD binding domain-containing protein [Xylariaceae sp. FL1651]|nr:FAD binding domain-containing protein [Xylariaceae sp. FL1651]
MRYCRRLPLVFFAVGVVTAIAYTVYHHGISATALRHYFTKPVISLFSDTSNLQMTAAKPAVIIVGSGLAGLSAAHEALKAGAEVHMLDRAPKPGGNSIKASSGINGAGTRFQAAANVIAVDDDDVSGFYDDTVRSAGARLQTQTQTQTAAGLGAAERKALIELMTAQSADAVHWLADDVGVDLSVVAQLGGHSAPRTHRGASGPPPGAAIVGALLKRLGADPKFKLTTSATVEALTLSGGDDGDGKVSVSGVRYTLDGQTHELRGPVVFAVGGFAGDAHGLLAKHRPDLAGVPSTNDARPGSHGLLDEVGAEFVDMDSVQIHPTGFVDPKDPAASYKFLAAEALRGEGGILLSSRGERFVDEMEKRDVVSEAIMTLPPSQLVSAAGNEGVRQWDVTLLLDPGASEACASHLGFYLFKGLMQKKKVKDLPPALIEAIDKYAAAVAAGSDKAFGRKTYGHWRLPAGDANREEEVSIGTVTPVTHFTMGGVAFNTQSQVLGRRGHSLAPINGVWAAGEITGGIHGDNRLGGSSLLECVIFGRIAGTEAAKSLSTV